MADIQAKPLHEDFVKIFQNKSICFVLDEEALSAVIHLFLEHGIDFGIIVDTKSGERHYDNVESFQAWIAKPHSAIQSIMFVTPDRIKSYLIYILFENSVDDPAIMWSLSGPERAVTEIDVDLKLILNKTKRPYFIVFAGSITTDVLNLIFIVAVGMFGFYSFIWILDRLGKTADNYPKKYLLPNGSTIELVPLKAINDNLESSFGQALFPYMIILLTTCILGRLLKPIFPVGVFEIGFGSGYERRRASLQNNIFWGGIVCFIIVIAAPTFWNYLSSYKM